MRRFAAALLLLTLVGCSLPVTLSRSELEDVVHDTEYDHVRYRGSDSKYHYLDRRVHGKRVKYKVSKDELEIPGKTFRPGMGDPYRLWSEALPY